MAELTVKTAFDRAARDYDRARRKLIPCFDDLYRAALEAIPFERERAVRVLDLGAGTGLLSFFIASALPRATITLVDVSEEMLARARELLAPGGKRFRFEAADYAVAPIEDKYEAVVSALSIHHLPDAGKRRLFEKIFAALEPGGVFVNADQLRGESATIERRNHENWIRRAREAGAGVDDLNAALERMKLDCAATLEAQLGWLREAGFSEVGCGYRNLIFGVYFAIK